MRVISGRLKGRKLRSARGFTVRPTADRVKEALFSILAHSCSGANVLDLFAGSGALGIEAISRGARSAVFVDSSPQALSALRRNLRHCKIEETAAVIRWNIARNLTCLNDWPSKFDLIFMDPPYHHHLVDIALRHLIHCDCMEEGAGIVAEHEPNCRIQLPDQRIHLADSRRYGSIQLSFFRYLPGSNI